MWKMIVGTFGIGQRRCKGLLREDRKELRIKH